MCDPRTRPRFIPAPGVLKFAMNYDLENGDIAENILHFHHKDDSAWTPTQMAALVSAFFTSWGTNIAPQCHSSVKWGSVRTTDLTSETGPSVVYTTNSNCSHTGENLPAGDTLAFKETTGLRGRSYRGRIYFVGLCDIRDSQDLVSSAYGTAILNGWRALLTDMNTLTNVEWVVVSYCNSNAWRSPAVSTPVISIDLVDYYIDYQRRRSTAHAVHR